MSHELREEIERVFNLKIIYEQFLPFGEFYWLGLTPTNHQPQSRLSIVNVYSFQELKLHTHSGYEEIII